MSEVGTGSAKPITWKGPGKRGLFLLLRGRVGIRSAPVFYSPLVIPQKVRRVRGRVGVLNQVVGQGQARGGHTLAHDHVHAAFPSDEGGAGAQVPGHR